jgi:hypothetical protein
MEIVHETLPRKHPLKKKKRVAQDVGPEFKPQYHKKQYNNNNNKKPKDNGYF